MSFLRKALSILSILLVSVSGTNNVTCGTYVCPPGYRNITSTNPNNIACLNDVCTTSTCCWVPTCSSSYGLWTVPTTCALKSNANSIQCSGNTVSGCSASLCCESTSQPTNAPTSIPTSSPTSIPTSSPTSIPSAQPTNAPTSSPTSAPSDQPTDAPTSIPTSSPTSAPSQVPTNYPTDFVIEPPTSPPTGCTCQGSESSGESSSGSKSSSESSAGSESSSGSKSSSESSSKKSYHKYMQKLKRK